MSANISQRKPHGAVLGATVADFAGWCLVASCLPGASAVAVHHRPPLKTPDISVNVVYGLSAPMRASKAQQTNKRRIRGGNANTSCSCSRRHVDCLTHP